MTKEKVIDFASAQAIITSESVEMHASELHGLLTGLICGGFTFESSEYIGVVNDMLNNGEGLTNEVKSLVKSMFSEVWQFLLDDSYGFQLILPDDDDSITERANGLGVWVQGFNLGFGLEQKNNASLSDDVKEILNDFTEIANLSSDVEEDEATEQAYYEISEYVRMSALLCFTELGVPPEKPSSDKILH